MKRAFAVTALAGLTALVACSDQSAPGTVELRLTRTSGVQPFAPAATPAGTHVASAVVVVDEIDARVAGAWTPLETMKQSIDLLKLDGTTLSSLGIVTLPAGKVDRLRLVLDPSGDYVTLDDGEQQRLVVPSDGIVEVEGTLHLDGCAAGVVIVELTPKIEQKQKKHQTEYVLACTAHVKTADLSGACGSGSGGAGGTGGAGGVGGSGGSGGAGGSGGTGVPCGTMTCKPGQACIDLMRVCVDPCPAPNPCSDPSKPYCVIYNGMQICLSALGVL